LKEAWKSFLTRSLDTETIEAVQKHERTGRPIGDKGFVVKMEKVTRRQLKSGKPEPKPKAGIKYGVPGITAGSVKYENLILGYLNNSRLPSKAKTC